MSNILVIGGSDAGVSAALRAREVAPGADVTVLVADEFPNFSIYGLPFFHSGEVADWRTLAHRSLSDLQASGDGLPGASHPRVHS
jgi:NADPH-dependent 2,4-dienoyl-CoA reductase/sulfur reductase-like enzyme